MKKLILFLFIGGQYAEIFAQPNLLFSKKLFGYEQNGPAGLPGCIPAFGGMPDVFTRISGQDPAAPLSVIYGNCTTNNSVTYAGALASDFRMSFTESVLTLYEVISDYRSKTIFTGGNSVIEKYNSTSGLYDTILIVNNFTVFANLKCSETFPGAPEFDGYVIADIVGGNSSFINEFTNNGKTNQVRARFLEFKPPSSLDSVKMPVMIFKTLVQLEPMPENGNEAFISGQMVTGIDSTLIFPENTGTKMKLNNYSPFSTDSTVIPAVTVCHFPWRDTIVSSATDKRFASVFNDIWWLLGSNLSNVSGEMCFNYNKLEKKLKRKLKPSQLSKLTISWQDSSGAGWNKIDSITMIDTLNQEICFRTTHFSNWAIALEKPAGDKIISMKDTVQGLFVTQLDTLEGFELKIPGTGISDSIHFTRYKIDPGGSFDTLLVKELSNEFWELTSANNSEGTIGLMIDDTSVSHAILYRPDPVSVWNNLPATRVRRGMKEVLLIKSANKNGQYIVSKTFVSDPEFFTITARTDTVCIGEDSQFNISVTGGVKPYTFIYDFGDGTPEITDLTGLPQNHKYPDPKTYYPVIRVTDANLVENEFSILVTVIPCSVSVNEHYFSNKKLYVFPNPNTEALFNLTFINPSDGIINLSVFDASGKEVISRGFHGNSVPPNTIIDLSKHPKGLYLVRYSDSSNISLLRLLYQ